MCAEHQRQRVECRVAIDDFHMLLLAEALRLVATTQPRSLRAAAERGWVPRRAGSAAARPHVETARIHPTRPAVRGRCGWSLRHSRAPRATKRKCLYPPFPRSRKTMIEGFPTGV